MGEEYRSSKQSIGTIGNDTKKMNLNDNDFTLKYLQIANNSDAKHRSNEKDFI